MLTPHWRGVTIAFISLGLSACASDPLLDTSSTEDVRLARTLLSDAVQEGPVYLDTNLPPEPLTVEDIATLAARGVPALSVTFTADQAQAGSSDYRLALRFVDKAALIDVDPCTAPATTSPPQAGFVGLAAGFCEGDNRIAEVAGPAGGPNVDDTRRLIWRTTQTLFPDDYEQTYGLRNLF